MASGADFATNRPCKTAETAQLPAKWEATRLVPREADGGPDQSPVRHLQFPQNGKVIGARDRQEFAGRAGAAAQLVKAPRVVDKRRQFRSCRTI